MTKNKNKRKPSHSKKRKNTKKSQNQNLKIINILLAIVVILMSIVTYLVLTSTVEETKEKPQIKKEKEVIISQEIEKEIKTISKELEIRKDKFEEYTKEFYKEYTDKIVPHKQTPEKVKVKKELEKNETIKKEIKEEKISSKSNNPKLVIIIDDVTTKSQLNKIENLGYKVTPSILPPTPNHVESANITEDLPFFMIHFPLEAQNFNAAERYTLRTTDSYEKIEKRVAQVRKWYPDALYTNNHTGSKFTSDEKSMNYLLTALKKHGFIFMDSRTTAKSVVKDLVHKYDMPYITRNIFIDNKKDFSYIQNQLKKAVKIAKKNGHSIAIGHPYPITLKVLNKSKELFKGLDLIYLNELPYLN